MTPTIHLVRHAQGVHNLNSANHSIRDPLLTPLGEEQCAKLRETFPEYRQVSLIVASPLRRTIYTALNAFRDILFDPVMRPGGPRIVALPEIQETSDSPCDTGKDLADLNHEFAGMPVDLSLVQEDWNSKVGKWAPRANEIYARAQEARMWLLNRPEEHIVVVTHGGFLHYFTEDWSDYSQFRGTGWQNTEFRSYVFDPSRQATASLVEMRESRSRRAGAEQSPPPTDQHDLGQKGSAPREVEALASKSPTSQAGPSASVHKRRDWTGGHNL